MRSGNQHGGHKCDDLQNWLHMTSHENPLFLGAVPNGPLHVKGQSIQDELQMLFRDTLISESEIVRKRHYAVKRFSFLIEQLFKFPWLDPTGLLDLT